MDKPVVVTGASGFIGKHIVKALLDRGYEVRGSVRSQVKAEETRQAVGPDGLDRLHFVELDLLDDDGWNDALAGAGALMHTASPFPNKSPKDPDELIRPAVDGTLRALRAAHDAGVNRVILTSSIAAIYNDTLRPDQTMFDETNWSTTDIPPASAYEASKTLAERAAWDYVVTNAPAMQLTTINPGVVLGTPLDDKYGTSLGLIERILKGSDPMLANLQFPLVDVEDVAAMHVLALETDASIGERFAACVDAEWMVEIAELLKAEFPDAGAKTRVAPDFLISAAAKVVPSLRSIAAHLGKSALTSSAKAEQVLGITFVPADETILRSARAIRA